MASLKQHYRNGTKKSVNRLGPKDHDVLPIGNRVLDCRNLSQRPIDGVLAEIPRATPQLVLGIVRVLLRHLI